MPPRLPHKPKRRAPKPGYHAKDTARTKLCKKRYLIDYADYGVISRAAKAAGIDRGEVYRWRERDPNFVTAEKEALEVALDRLEQEAVRRGRDGWKEPVYQLGQMVGVVRKFDNQLLMFLLRGKRPEVYKDRQEVTGKNGQPLIQLAPVASMTDEELIASAAEHAAMLVAARQ